MYATKISMRSGCNSSNKCEEIDSIYLTGNNTDQFYTKAVIHDHVKTNPGSIQVNLSPYPSLVPAVSSRGEKYVHSKADGTANDNLLKLPRV